jgi:hypothetical protein
LIRWEKIKCESNIIPSEENQNNCSAGFGSIIVCLHNSLQLLFHNIEGWSKLTELSFSNTDYGLSNSPQNMTSPPKQVPVAMKKTSQG